MNFAAQLCKQITGKYNLSRRIETGSEPPILIQGTASFRPGGKNTWLYEEQGSYSARGKIYQCQQKRLFIAHKRRLEIRKSNGESLHEFALNESPTIFPYQLEHVHLCVKDSYRISLILLKPGLLSTLYQVLGPKKDYLIESELKLQSSAL